MTSSKASGDCQPPDFDCIKNQGVDTRTRH